MEVMKGYEFICTSEVFNVWAKAGEDRKFLSKKTITVATSKGQERAVELCKNFLYKEYALFRLAEEPKLVREWILQDEDLWMTTWPMCIQTQKIECS